MILLKKATLRQILKELGRRDDLTFAVVLLQFGARDRADIFSSDDLNVLETVRLLMAGAQDVLEWMQKGMQRDEDAPPLQPETPAKNGLRLHPFWPDHETPGEGRARHRKPRRRHVDA